MRRIAVFYHGNPCPPRAGTHQRCLQVLRGLREVGCQVTFLTSNHWADPAWTPSHALMLRAMTGAEARVCPLKRMDRRFIDSMLKWQRSRPYRMFFGSVPVASYASSPPYLRRWFRRQLSEVAPDAVMINYVMFDRLLNHQRHVTLNRILETHDLMTVSFAMRSAVEAALSRLPADWSDVPESSLALDFAGRLNLRVARNELETMDRYTTTVAICREEAGVIGEGTRRTRVVTVPAVSPEVENDNDYRGPALFVTGRNNPFNVHGALVLAKRVLPRVLEQVPDFAVHLTGDGTDRIPGLPGLVKRGFVEDLSAEYASAAFVTCPVLAGTGQQVKILEAMAHGLAVVAWRHRAGDAPIQNGLNGFLCDTVDEFVERSVQLWRDRKMCRELGRQARLAIRRVAAGFLPAIEDVLSGCGTAPGGVRKDL